MGTGEGKDERGENPIHSHQRTRRWQGDAGQQDPRYDGRILHLGNAQEEAKTTAIAKARAEATARPREKQRQAPGSEPE